MPGVPLPDRLRAGKYPAAQLAAALAQAAVPHPRLIVGPRVGEDAAVIEMGQRCLVVATDPITFVASRAGWYAVHVNANDIAVMGAQPRWFFAVVLMPEGCRSEDVRTLLEEVGATCSQLNVTLAGGHTEITAGIPHPIVVGQMIGEAQAADVITKAGLREGDAVVLTHGAAIEGTAILAREMGPSLEGRVDADVLARARQLLVDPGLSVVPAVGVLTRSARVHSMHDPTEGGVLAGLHELAAAGGLGLHVWADRIPVLPETQAICGRLGVNPLTLIASGSLLASVPAEDAEGAVRSLAEAGIPAAVVAEVRERAHGIVLERDGACTAFEPPERDEIARVLGEG